MNIEQIKAAIAAGQCKKIYYSAHTLWWTHSEADLKESTELGKAAQVVRSERTLADPNISDEKKQRLKGLLEMINGGSGTIPLDPSGSPLMQYDNPTEWIERAEQKPEHFGTHGIQAFLKAHHHNCGGLCFSRWQEYNLLCDKT